MRVCRCLELATADCADKGIQGSQQQQQPAGFRGSGSHAESWRHCTWAYISLEGQFTIPLCQRQATVNAVLAHGLKAQWA